MHNNNNDRGSQGNIPLLVGVKEIARVLDVSEPTIYGWVKQNINVKPIYVGRQIRFDLAETLKLFEAKTAEKTSSCTKLDNILESQAKARSLKIRSRKALPKQGDGYGNN